jgi:PAS domain-containing protein
MRALQLSEQKNRALLQALPDTIFIVDREGVLLEHITGSDKPSASLVGKMLEEVFPPAWRSAAGCCQRPASGAPSTYEFTVGRGKEQRSFEARLRRKPDGTLLIVTRDTTERRKAKARIEYLAYYDILTGCRTGSCSCAKRLAPFAPPSSPDR